MSQDNVHCTIYSEVVKSSKLLVGTVVATVNISVVTENPLMTIDGGVGGGGRVGGRPWRNETKTFRPTHIIP